MTSKLKGELYRDPGKGKIAGVCAGIANYFSWEVWLVRVLVVSGVLLGMGWFIVVYIAGWFILDKKPKNFKSTLHGSVNTGAKASDSFASEEPANESIKVKSRVWQAGEPPKQAFYDIKRKFTVLEGQLRSMERYVTSPEFTVSREINKL
jgi:phage shock protein C